MWAVRVAADHGQKLSVRGGGHNVAGRSIADGTLMLDLSKLRAVRLDAAARLTSVQGGALWSDVDAATAEVGLATTGGFVSTTGVGGLTLGDGVGGVMPYVQWQKMQDAGAPPGRYHYWKTVNFDALTDAALERLVAAAREFPSPTMEIHVQHLGGAVSRAPRESSAFASRRVPFFANLIGCSMTQEGFAAARERVRQLHAELAPAAEATMQPNFTDQDDSDPARRFGAAGVRRLMELRTRFDPAGTFSSWRSERR